MLDANKVKQALICCATRSCGTCPYNVFERPELLMSCVHQLMQDVGQLCTMRSCETCANGSGLLLTAGVKNKCYCRRTHLYEDPTHYCSKWEPKEVDS